MKASELRIGNLLENFLGQEFEVNHETLRMLSVGGSGSEFNLPKPIPLTEEWLLKFGLHGNHSSPVRVGLVDDDFVLQQFTVMFMNAYIKVKYVHQLQNLYHALTGEELKQS